MSELESVRDPGVGAITLYGWTEQNRPLERRADMFNFHDAALEWPAQAMKQDLNQALREAGSPVMRELLRDMHTPAEDSPLKAGVPVLSADRRGDVYAAMARQLDAETLAAWVSAFDDPNELVQQMSLISRSTSRDTQLALFKLLLPDMRAPVRDDTVFNPAAMAAFRLLSAQRGADFRAFAEWLQGDEDLEAALVQASGPRSGPFVSPEPAGLLFEAAASCGDAQLQARLFRVAGQALEARDDVWKRLGYNASVKDRTTEVLSNGMTRLLDVDTRGIVAQLCRPGFTKPHVVLRAYVLNLLERDRSRGIEVVLRQSAQLEGEGITDDAVEYLNRGVPGERGTPYVNARIAFTYAAAVGTALGRIDATTARQAENFQWELSSLLVLGNYTVRNLSLRKGVLALAVLGVRAAVVQRAAGIQAEGRQLMIELDRVADPRGHPFYETDARLVALAALHVMRPMGR